MARFSIEITQVFKATRTIVVVVEAEDQESAYENVVSGAVDTPAFDDPNWKTGWDLQNEQVRVA